MCRDSIDLEANTQLIEQTLDDLFKITKDLKSHSTTTENETKI
jgi:hypothetical protein